MAVSQRCRERREKQPKTDTADYTHIRKTENICIHVSESHLEALELCHSRFVDVCLGSIDSHSEGGHPAFFGR